jgi:RNA recognition motif-containing protein
MICLIYNCIVEEMSHQGQGDLGDKSSCTAFVSNLAYNMDEGSIKEVFSKVYVICSLLDDFQILIYHGIGLLSKSCNQRLINILFIYL